ncbi:MAG: PEP/pyruvate-binding domain-containing protein [Candidatus Moranbacteria bacterium]|nr:PEP/pyruvate-binding domain-containing protein [Candidatus Moranbacteria bacterium]
MYTKTFKEISKKDVGIAGGKGASLGEMSGSGIPVPPGFVITIDAFDRFLEETDLGVDIVSILKNINYKDMSSVDKASHEIRDMIHDVPMPKDLAKLFLGEFKKLKAPYVAVRSSATAEDSAVASWAGELETYLNTTGKKIFENIKKCWSSLFTQRALFYAFEKQVFTKKHQQKIRAGTSKIKDSYPVSVAVVVQKMVQSDISGICFTVHPVTENKKQMVIEAGYGLGEAIVSGQVTPDTYVVDKQDFSIADINFSEQTRMIVKKKGEGVEWKPVPKKTQNRQKLTGKQIVELAKLCDRIEKHYKKPQDIEWALEKGKFYITQSRPITTLTRE